MVDYVKFRNSSPLPRKSKKFDGARYKEYLYGSVESLDMDWADKIVDYNPNMKLDTSEFTKLVDRNVSMSTECGFDPKSSLNSNDLSSNEDLNLSLTEYTSHEAQFQQLVKGGYAKAVISPCVDQHKSTYDNKMFNFVEYQKHEVLQKNFDELQKKYDNLSAEFSKYKGEQESYVNDAELYRSCKQRMGDYKVELDSEDDPKQCLELLLEQIYAILSDTFGPENTLVLHLEKFANIYMDYQNKTEVELAALRGKAEVVDSLEKLIADKADYDKLVEQKDRTIESLVDELKTSKLDHADELTSLKNEFDSVSAEYHVKLEQYGRDLSKYKGESESLGELVTHWKNQYTKLLDDQHQILSQLPVATLTTSNDSTQSQELHKLDFKANSAGAKLTSNGAFGWLEDKLSFSWKGPDHSPAVNNGSNGPALKHDPFKPSFVPLISGGASANPWVKLGDKPTWNPATDSVGKNKPAGSSFDNKFLQSLVETLYKKNEHAIDELRKKDEEIKKLNDSISKLRQSVKEWESDAVLWLDYVDQSSSVLKGVH
ncbi:conserved hypothetical protein [Theileria orientalis strain Shintoku]|uniref:Uncharacterized protein n=1 Tax=Theileria orientalis strain Shintoku TaxID=869250 RepID=J4C808_THEOR|nr:conserved hypothetical protein [Theileria orientalis strain Shintoku]PVC53070.1 hypothetical protein MACL_00000344 [Theileria orientalis]BAM39963.1 conserved hypothetical protein [Theileria orientalis strain Shintoku]|eukprot:XP_009690264.1 conserved hypothetical protein [Theileria orientalis strain Shintoku]